MIKNIFTTFTTRLITAFISFVLLLLTTNYLGAEGRGAISLLTASAGLINLFSGFIGGAALVYLIPKNRNRTFIWQTLLISYIWASFVSGIVTCALIFTKSIPENLAIHIFFIGIFISVFSLHTIILVAFEKIFLQNIATFIQILINFLIFSSSIFLLKIINIAAFIFSLYFSYIISSLLSFILAIKEFPKEERKIYLWDSIKEILKFGSVSQLGNVIQYLNYRLSYYILNYYTTLALVGVYSVGVMFSETVWMIPGSISLVQYSRIANSEDLDYSRNLTLRLAKFSFIATLFVVFIFILLPYDIFSGMFGKDFKPVKSVMIYLSPGIAIFGYTVIISHYFAGTGRYIVNTKADFLGLIITLIFNFTLVPKYGYIGAAVTASLSYLTTGLFLLFSFLRETKTRGKELFISMDDVEFFLIKAGLKNMVIK